MEIRIETGLTGNCVVHRTTESASGRLQEAKILLRSHPPALEQLPTEAGAQPTSHPADPAGPGASEGYVLFLAGGSFLVTVIGADSRYVVV
jgi:hypothetical protein